MHMQLYVTEQTVKLPKTNFLNVCAEGKIQGHLLTKGLQAMHILNTHKLIAIILSQPYSRV